MFDHQSATAACCLPDSSCSDLAEGACDIAGGVYLAGSCQSIECQAHGYFIFLKSGSVQLVFDKFESYQDKRGLLEVKLRADATASAGFTLEILEGRQTCVMESQTRVDFIEVASASVKGVSEVTPLQILDARSTGFGGALDPLYCGDPDPDDEPALCPPANPQCDADCGVAFCDYGGPANYFGLDEVVITSPVSLTSFKAKPGDATFYIELLGTASWIAPSGAFLSAANPTNEAQGTVIVMYRFQEFGVCCLPNNSCVTSTREDCKNFNGIFSSEQVCGSPGACCLPNGVCVETAEFCCDSIGGTFGGGACGGTSACCPADLASPMGVVDVFDLFVLLSHWNAAGPGADLAMPYGVVDVADLFVLLSSWGDC